LRPVPVHSSEDLPTDAQRRRSMGVWRDMPPSEGYTKEQKKVADTPGFSLEAQKKRIHKVLKR